MMPRYIYIRKTNTAPYEWFIDELELRKYRHTTETVNIQLEKRGVEQQHAQTNSGLESKVHTSLIALTCTNFNQQSRYNISWVSYPM